MGYIQLQMAAAIAHMGGYDVRDDRVKTFCYVCLCGESASKVLRAAGITIGKKLTEQMVRRLSFETIKKINQAVGFRMITKFGQTGLVNLGKGVPLAGGLVGGAFDGATSYAVGKAAKRTFIEAREAQSTPATDSGPGFWAKEVSKVERDMLNLGERIWDELAELEDALLDYDEDEEDRRDTW